HGGADGQRVGQGCPAGEFRGGELGGDLPHRERVPARAGHEAGDDGRGHLRVGHVRDELGGIGAGEAAHHELVEAVGVERGGLVAAGGGEQAEAVVLDAAGDERQHARRGRVEDVGVVDDDGGRRVLGRGGEQGEGGDRYDERVARRAGAEPEGCFERVALRWEQRREQVVQWAQYIGQGGEREVLLGLARPGGQYAHLAIGGQRGGTLEERRLADAGLARDHEGAAAGGLDVGGPRVEDGEL